MFGVADYWAFVIAVIVFLAIPGVGNLAIITSTSKGRIAGGLAATFGVIVGDQPRAIRRHPVRRRRLPRLAWHPHDRGEARSGADPRYAAGPVLPAGDVHHVAQPEGHRLLHGLLSALRRPCPASGPRHFRGDGAHHRRSHARLLPDRHLHHAFRRRTHAREPPRR